MPGAGHGMISFGTPSPQIQCAAPYMNKMLEVIGTALIGKARDKKKIESEWKLCSWPTAFDGYTTFTIKLVGDPLVLLKQQQRKKCGHSTFSASITSKLGCRLVQFES